MTPTLHVGYLPDALDERVVHVPGRVHPHDLEVWLATLFATRRAVLGESDPYEIACNSPALADFFEPENVVVWSRSGASARLVEHPRCEHWRAFGSGAMWRRFGESWVDEEERA